MRIFDKSDRRYIKIYHGPVTKSYGNTESLSKSNETGLNISLFNTENFDSSTKYRSVGSDVERYFRSSAEGCHPKWFQKWGYPRFDRIDRFISGDADPILTDDARRILETDEEYTNILYAPTHKDGEYITTFFPFFEFDSDQLREWCKTHNVRIFLRPHPSEDPDLEHLIDNETIYFAGQNFANAPTELMPFMQVLITDYSSIYVPYLLFNRPIIFVKDRHQKYENVRGLAFNYDQYFPGIKPDTFDEFLSSAGDIVEGHDNQSDERLFVRKTFIPPRDQTFLRKCSQDFNINY